MITVAVTGGIGSGKSTVSAALRERGAVVVDSDQLAREVVAPGTPGLAAIAEAFGPAMIDPAGALDRAALAAVVFADPDARTRLERITHPLVRERFAALRRLAPDDAVVVNDIPLLTTLSVAAGFALVVGVRADAGVRVRRLVERGLGEADARARMAAQLTDEQRAGLCDVVLANDGRRADLESEVDGLWTNRLVPFERNVRAGVSAPRRRPELAPPRPEWAADGRRLAARVSAAAGGARVDHIGSTAIPGMPAKDVLDLQLTVRDLAEADALEKPLAAAGFPRRPGVDGDPPHPLDGGPAQGDRVQGDRVQGDRVQWHKRLHANADPGRYLNLHLRVRDSAGWRWALLFRDWLTADPTVAAEYLALKRELAGRFAADPTAARYAAAKEPWFDDAYPRGLAWARRTGWSPQRQDDSEGTVGPPA